MDIPIYCFINFGIVEVGLMALAVGLSLLAAKMLAKKPDTPIVDDKPTTLTTRGAFIAWLVGRRRVGPVVGYAASRYTIKEKSDGGKGFFSPDAPKVTIYYESGWHQLAVGPCDVLHAIYQGGKILFQGPITRTSHPSGTAVNLGSEGTFYIYWGEQDQPLNTTLASQTTISSRWPHCCYIHWHPKRLGSTPIWQLMEYDIERFVSNSVLSGSDAYMDPDVVLSSTVVDIYDNNDGAAGVGWFELVGDWSPLFGPTDKVRLTGNAMGDTDLVISSVTTEQRVGFPFGLFQPYITYTKLRFTTALSGTDDNGSLTLYKNNNVGGINPAHAIAEVLFAEFPMGLGKSTTDWDLDSLEALGTLTQIGNEKIPCSLIGINGENADAILGMALQDLGVLLPIHPTNGKLYFNTVREPTGSLQELKEAQINDPLPQIETIHGDTTSDKFIFSFQDWEHAFKDMTIAIDEDGQAEFLEHQRAKKIRIGIAVDIKTAAKIAERRSQEELAGAVVYSVTANHGARLLIPGEAVLMENIDDILRVISVMADPETSKTKLKLMADVYGAKKSTFENEGGGGEFNYDPALQDAHFTYVEIPEYWLAGGPMTIMIPRIRNSDDIAGANIYISRDDVTYTYMLPELAAATGGVLLEEIAIDGEKSLATGPTFTVSGPDIATALDLSADELNWRLGRQILVWGSEVAFVQKITAIGGDTYRLDGILRARWDTEREVHPVGQPVFIFEANDFELIEDLLLAADVDLYVKTQPYTSGSIVNLDASPKLHVNNTVGKGIVPMRPLNLALTAPAPLVRAFETGDNIGIAWSYMSASQPSTGAGMQAKGAATSSSAPQGEFKLQILNTSNVVKRTVTTTDTSYSYSNANLVADFGFEPPSFKIRITVVRGGTSSEYQEITVTRE
jgi:hypothetical protein